MVRTREAFDSLIVLNSTCHGAWKPALALRCAPFSGKLDNTFLLIWECLSFDGTLSVCFQRAAKMTLQPLNGIPYKGHTRLLVTKHQADAHIVHSRLGA